jgi:hypothetical protein
LQSVIGVMDLAQRMIDQPAVPTTMRGVPAHSAASETLRPSTSSFTPGI